MCRYNHIHVAEVLAAKAVETLPLIPDTLRHVAEVLAAKAVETLSAMSTLLLKVTGRRGISR